MMRGRAAFEQTYGDLYQERWPTLLQSLCAPAEQVARVNAYALTNARLSPFYELDLASVFPALALHVQSGEKILDMCAAPGGKSLILAEKVGSEGRLICNEMSMARRSRLKAVLHDYLPPEVLARVQVTGHDASKWGLYEKSEYSAVLVDAPCSGERHLLQNAREMEEWSPKRSKNLATRQYALLAAALQTVQVGGRIVYSTCSISPLENEGVIQKLLKKKAGQVEEIPPSCPIGEKAIVGWKIWPDQAGWGPIYFCSLKRTT